MSRTNPEKMRFQRRPQKSASEVAARGLSHNFSTGIPHCRYRAATPSNTPNNTSIAKPITPSAIRTPQGVAAGSSNGRPQSNRPLVSKLIAAVRQSEGTSADGSDGRRKGPGRIPGQSR
jgi:hypothetical protein